MREGSRLPPPWMAENHAENALEGMAEEKTDGGGGEARAYRTFCMLNHRGHSRKSLSLKNLCP